MAYAPSVAMHENSPPADRQPYGGHGQHDPHNDRAAGFPPLGVAPSAFGQPEFGPGESPGESQRSADPFWRSERLVDPRVSDADRWWVIVSHLWWVTGLVLIGPFALAAPITMWAVRQSGSGFADDHGREIVNMQITLAILVIIPVFWPILPVWVVIAIVNSIRGACAAHRREHFRYPAIFRPWSS
ncbi:MAG: DUF4870 domain-containing protein [Phycisphaerae bacterium]|nr:DUF4870 domain-containing protein [Phycisphaerae bacterium]